MEETRGAFRKKNGVRTPELMFSTHLPVNANNEYTVGSELMWLMLIGDLGNRIVVC